MFCDDDKLLSSRILTSGLCNYEIKCPMCSPFMNVLPQFQILWETSPDTHRLVCVLLL